MNLTAAQIEYAWQELESGAAVEDLRGSWDRIAATRHEFNDTLVALAQELNRLRNLVPPAGDWWKGHRRRDHEGERGIAREEVTS